MNDNKIQTMIVGIRKTLEDIFRKMDEIELQLQDIMGELKIEDPVEREYNPFKKIVGGPEAMKKWDWQDAGDMMMKGGGPVLPKSSGIPLPDIDVDLPDEMFEDMLHAEVRNKTGKTGGKTYVSPTTGFWTDKSGALKLGNSGHIAADQRFGYEAKGYGCLYPGTCHVVSPHYVGVCTPSLGSFVDPGDLLKDLAEFLDEEPVTQPMVAVPVSTSDFRAQRKKEGVCPDCGDVKNETAVGVCSLHGKFLG